MLTALTFTSSHKIGKNNDNKNEEKIISAKVIGLMDCWMGSEEK
jgi:hypothetical protein